MNLLCRIFGHQAKTIVSSDIVNYVGGGLWFWPGAITFCPRCGFVFQRHNQPEDHPTQPPWDTCTVNNLYERRTRQPSKPPCQPYPGSDGPYQ